MHAPLVHVTTVHSRRDVRIYHKEMRSLRALGRKLVLVVADGLGSGRDDVQDVGFVDVGPLRRGRLARVILGNIRSFRAVSALKPALVHFHDPELIFMALALKAQGHRIVYDVHEDYPQQVHSKHWIPKPFRWFAAKSVSTLEHLAKRKLDAFVAATPRIADNFPSARTILVQNYPQSEELRASEPQSYAQRPLDVAYMGGITALRGGRKMVEAMALLSRHLPQARLKWAGPVVPQSFLDDVRALPGWEKVDYHGVVERAALATFLGTSRAGLVVLQPMPNYLDSQPNKLFEYMAAGLPVIASDFPLWRRIVMEVDCGLLVNPEDPAAISNAVAWVLQNHESAEAMGLRGKEAVSDRYNWRKEEGKLTRLYTDLLSDRRTGSCLQRTHNDSGKTTI